MGGGGGGGGGRVDGAGTAEEPAAAEAPPAGSSTSSAAGRSEISLEVGEFGPELGSALRDCTLPGLWRPKIDMRAERVTKVGTRDSCAMTAMLRDEKD